MDEWATWLAVGVGTGGLVASILGVMFALLARQTRPEIAWGRKLPAGSIPALLQLLLKPLPRPDSLHQPQPRRDNSGKPGVRAGISAWYRELSSYLLKGGGGANNRPIRLAKVSG